MSEQPRPLSVGDFDRYLIAPTTNDRELLLKNLKSKNHLIGWDFIKPLMNIIFNIKEKARLFDYVNEPLDATDEKWLFKNLIHWHQDIASSALRAWSSLSSHNEWPQLLTLLSFPGLPQRINYTVLDIAPQIAGFEITSKCLSIKGWQDYSSAYHALLFDRAIEFNIQSTDLTTLAKRILNTNQRTHHPDDKSLFSAVTWLVFSNETKWLKSQLNRLNRTSWQTIVLSEIERDESSKKAIDKLKKSLESDNPKFEDLESSMPNPWSRRHIPEATVTSLLSSNLFKSLSDDIRAWTLAGLPLHQSQQKSVRSQQPKNPERLRTPLAQHAFSTYWEASTFEQKKSGMSELNSEYWTALSDASRQSQRVDLSKISQSARKISGISALTYLSFLGRQVGSDEAVLKLMDFVRSADEDILLTIVDSLDKIDTSRSLLELIAMITRPNSTVAVQLAIAAILTRKDVSQLQTELRAAVKDLVPPVDASSPVVEVREILTSLLETSPASMVDAAQQSSRPMSEINDQALDDDLKRMLPQYSVLSSEVRRALRTALFFNKTTMSQSGQLAIDLSPLIDMQYKAMELLFREQFEDFVSQQINRGEISRKLDVIGYARPIPQKMDEFENFIASLPVVKEIPFFSKFKLRKMLRAICQFEPGRRFTLDGLKAFGLFFLCFGRKNCKFGLSGQLDLGFSTDHELAEFCKVLHIYQDFRNRAAHEGFHPDASNDIEGIWQSTAICIQGAFSIRENIDRSKRTDASSKRAS